MQKCSRRRLLSSRCSAPSGASAAPRSAGGRRCLRGTGKGLGAGPRVAGSGAAPALRRELRAGVGLGFAARPRGARRAWGSSATTLVRRRPSRRAVSGPGPATPGERLCSAQRPAPSHPAEGKPAPGARILAAPQSRSSPSYSLSGGSSRGGPGGRARRPLRPSRRGHPTPPANSPARTAPRAPGRVPSPSPTPGAFGACGSPRPRCERARREAGRKESDLKSHGSSLPLLKPRGERGRRDARGRPLRSPARAAPLVPRPRSRAPSLLIGGRRTPPLRHRERPRPRPRLAEPGRGGGRGVPRRWLRRAGRGRRGPAAAPAPPPPPRASLSPELPGARLPGRRLVRAHPERAGAPGEGAPRGGGGSAQAMPAAGGVGGTPAPPRPRGWRGRSIPGGDEDIPLRALAAPRGVAGNGWRENLAWRPGSATLGAGPRALGWVGSVRAEMLTVPAAAGAPPSFHRKTHVRAAGSPRSLPLRRARRWEGRNPKTLLDPLTSLGLRKNAAAPHKERAGKAKRSGGFHLTTPISLKFFFLLLGFGVWGFCC